MLHSMPNLVGHLDLLATRVLQHVVETNVDFFLYFVFCLCSLLVFDFLRQTFGIRRKRARGCQQKQIFGRAVGKFQMFILHVVTLQAV